MRPRPRELIFEPGAGAGILSLLLARRHPRLRLVALELQQDLARCAGENFRSQGCADRCFVVRGNIRDAPSLFPAGTFDRVVANPPFRAAGAGRVSPDPSRALARQESEYTLARLAEVSSSLLRFGGALDIIHLAERLPEIVRTLSSHGLEPKSLRFVAPFPDTPPGLLLLSARKGGKPGLTVRPQLAVHERPGTYTDEVAAALASPEHRPRRKIRRAPTG